jgi:hypothetical protein
MGWLLFEAAVALAIALFIVWWTWPRPQPKRPPGDDMHKTDASRASDDGSD